MKSKRLKVDNNNNDYYFYNHCYRHLLSPHRDSRSISSFGSEMHKWIRMSYVIHWCRPFISIVCRFLGQLPIIRLRSKAPSIQTSKRRPAPQTDLLLLVAICPKSWGISDAMGKTNNSSTGYWQRSDTSELHEYLTLERLMPRVKNSSVDDDHRIIGKGKMTMMKLLLTLMKKMVAMMMMMMTMMIMMIMMMTMMTTMMMTIMMMMTTTMTMMMTWDVMAPWLSRLLSTRGSWVRLPL